MSISLLSLHFDRKAYITWELLIKVKIIFQIKGGWDGDLTALGGLV